MKWLPRTLFGQFVLVIALGTLDAPLLVAQGLGLVRDILEDNWVLGEGNQLSDQDLGRLGRLLPAQA